MESTTNTISEATLKKQTVDHLNKYNRDSYHARKKVSDCERYKKTV